MLLLALAEHQAVIGGRSHRQGRGIFLSAGDKASGGMQQEWHVVKMA
jgi:hypothetical protein